MVENQKIKEEKARSTVELFWQAIPPIWHAARSITHETATEEFHITVSQFHTLRRISDGNGSVSDLADCMHLSRSNISRSVDELVNYGYVNREQDAQDRRNVNLTLTESGKKLIQSLLISNGNKMMEKINLLDDGELDDISCGLIALQKVFGKKENTLGKR
ncbi:MAG: MarR family transcriptional regulator [Pelolinea sp.]|nr:MarR family transcriptional regulator [Pelolinea sp.]